MSVAVGKIPGVEKVSVSLNKALVTIDLKSGNTVRLQQIRKAILDDAFTPKDAAVTVIGEVMRAKGNPVLKMTGTGQVYELAPAPKGARAFHALARKQGKTVLMRGIIPPPTGTKVMPRLLVESFRVAA